MSAKSNVVGVDLRPNRSLIDSKFDSYKLSLAPLPFYKCGFDCGVHTVPVTDDYILYERIRCLTMHNYLVSDQWNTDNVYFVDRNGCIRRFMVSMESHIEPSQVMFSFGSFKTVNKLPTSIHFPSATLCVACDGSGSTYVLQTGERNSKSLKPWTVLYKDDVQVPTLLLYSNFRCMDDADHVDILLLHFEAAGPNENEKDKEIVVVEWTSLSKTRDADQYQSVGDRTFKGKSLPNYAALSADCAELFFASNASLEFVPGWSTEQDVDLREEESSRDTSQPPAPYKWKQSGEDLIVRIPLPPDATKNSVIYSLSRSKIHLAVRKSPSDPPETILTGNLYLEAEPESSNWVITEGQLEVTIQKHIEGHTWPCIVEGDDRGELDYDPEEVARAHEKLAHLTSDTLNNDDKSGVLFNSGQTEECDSYYDSEATLFRFDAATNAVTHTANVSSLKWIFNCSLGPNQPPCFVLRHDVDGVVWQPTEPVGSTDARLIWKHQATFNALGYVHASKTNVKFCACAFDASYVALCECQRRIFLYRQPSPLTTSLRNRTSGEVVGKVALQQVATIDNNDDIYGFVATNERMFVLTEKELIVFKVAIDEGA